MMNRKMLLTFLMISSGCLYAADNRDEFVGFDLSRFLVHNNGVTEIAEESNTPEKLKANLEGLRTSAQQGEILPGEVRGFRAIGTLAEGPAREVRDRVLAIINDPSVVEDQGLTKPAR
ncbi:MAG: hypothetical protein WD055_03305 [Candidatus Dependentiae bacterium]